MYYALLYKDLFKRSSITLRDITWALRKRGYAVLGAGAARKARKGKAGGKKGKKAGKKSGGKKA